MLRLKVENMSTGEVKEYTEGVEYIVPKKFECEDDVCQTADFVLHRLYEEYNPEYNFEGTKSDMTETDGEGDVFTVIETLTLGTKHKLYLMRG